jgi:acyl-coenzyme A thioesterase 13
MNKNRLAILHGGTIASMVDLGGSLAVASRGLFATGVSTDLNVTYLSSGGKVGDLIKAEVTCDKCTYILPLSSTTLTACSWKNVGIHFHQLQQQQRRGFCKGKSH